MPLKEMAGCNDSAHRSLLRLHSFHSADLALPLAIVFSADQRGAWLHPGVPSAARAGVFRLAGRLLPPAALVDARLPAHREAGRPEPGDAGGEGRAGLALHIARTRSPSVCKFCNRLRRMEEPYEPLLIGDRQTPGQLENFIKCRCVRHFAPLFLYVSNHLMISDNWGLSRGTASSGAAFSKMALAILAIRYSVVLRPRTISPASVSKWPP